MGDFIADAMDLLDEGQYLTAVAFRVDLLPGRVCCCQPDRAGNHIGLGDRMRRLRNEAPIDSQRDRIQVAYECPTPGDERHGIRKSKADFRFEKKFEEGFAAAFVVEAKPSARTR